MTKLKMVVEVSIMNGDKSRSKALKVAVGIRGVESAALGEKDNNQLVVIGSIDPVKLTTKLRKKLAKPKVLRMKCAFPESRSAYAKIISVSPVDEKKDEKKEEKKEDKGLITWTSVPLQPQYVYCPDSDPNPCSIL